MECRRCIKHKLLPTETETGMLLHGINGQAATQTQNIADPIRNAQMTTQAVFKPVGKVSGQGNHCQWVAEASLYERRDGTRHRSSVTGITYIRILEANDTSLRKMVLSPYIGSEGIGA